MGNNRKNASMFYGLAILAGGAYMLAYTLWLEKYAGANFVTWPGSLLFFAAHPLFYFGVGGVIVQPFSLDTAFFRGVSPRAAKGLFVLSLTVTVLVAACILVHLAAPASVAAVVQLLMVFSRQPWLYAILGAVLALSRRLTQLRVGN